MSGKEKLPSSSVGLQQSAKFSRQNAQNTILNSEKKTSSRHNTIIQSEKHFIIEQCQTNNSFLFITLCI